METSNHKVISESLRALKHKALDAVKAILTEKGVADFVESSCGGNCPVVFESVNEEETCTVDRVYIDSGGNPVCDFSNSYMNDWIMVSSLPIETILDILDELENNDGLFIGDEEEEDE